MVKIREAIVVEGKYDKITLSQVVTAPIIETSGFGIMKDRALMDYLRAVARARGIIVFTDSDGAGFVIRNRIRAAIDPGLVKHAYIPDVYGKEKRKTAPGKEGKLGVEGMPPQVILQCLQRAGATLEDGPEGTAGGITKQDMMALGLSGCKNSALLRKRLLQRLALPLHLSANGLLQALNLLYTPQTLAALVADLEKEQ